jgi:hypothetical protein
VPIICLAAGLGAFACFRGVVVSSGPSPMANPAYGVLDCSGVLSIQALESDGRFGHEWSFAAGRLAYNRRAPNGYENVYVSLPDGGDERSLTLGHPALPGKHACSPVWTPSGDYLIFSAEKGQHPGSSLQAFCGFGAYADLWAISSDGSRTYRLTDVPNDSDHGAMIPRLSRDGSKLLWTERVGSPNIFVPERAFGSWVLKVASLHFDDGGVWLADAQQLQPGDPGFYEGADFTPDGKGILYTSSAATHNAWRSQIFVLDLSTKAVTQLTQADYNEHPRYTPDGQRIVWMSSTGATLKGTDWWFMNADGSDKRRLTFFEERGNPQSSGSAVYPGTVAWDPSEKWFIGDVETSLLTQDYASVRVSCAAVGDAG